LGATREGAPALGLDNLLGKMPTAKQLEAWSTQVTGQAKNGNLHRYFQRVKQVYLPKKAKKVVALQASSASAPTVFNTDLFNILLEKGVDANDAARIASGN
jgi:uncharacterized membrane protein